MQGALWFDRLTMTGNRACPEPVEGRGAAQRRRWAFL